MAWYFIGFYSGISGDGRKQELYRPTRCSHSNKMPVSEDEIILLTDGGDWLHSRASVCLMSLNSALNELKMEVWGCGPGDRGLT